MNRREVCFATLGGLLAASGPTGSQRSRDRCNRSQPDDPCELTLTEASAAIREGTLTSRQLTLACLARTASANPTINALITVMGEAALRQAAQLDAEARTGRLRSPLHGIPIVVKDVIDVAGTPTTAASAAFGDEAAAEDAFVVGRLRDAGAVILAKANLAELSMSTTSASSHFGPARNPWAPVHVTGGSSGGSAAAVAARMCPGALGTDTGGSVRIPSAWCGVVGLKPTSGLVSNRGIVPLIPMMDTCGPIARSAKDVALLLEQMAGHDALDARSVLPPHGPLLARAKIPVPGMRVGVPRRPFFDDLDLDVARRVEDALALIGRLTACIRDVLLPSSVRPPDTLVVFAEIYSAHYQQFAGKVDQYQPVTRKLLQESARFLNGPAGGTTAQRMSNYIRARADIEHQRLTIDSAFMDFDVLALPTMKSLPPTLQDALAAENDPVNLASEFTIDNTFAFNAAGLPSLSVPCGFSAGGLPVGIMLCGPRFSERRLLDLAQAYQRVTHWHDCVPPPGSASPA